MAAQCTRQTVATAEKVDGASLTIILGENAAIAALGRIEPILG
ncbi:MAG: hypothetical protein ABSB35_17735 [Bryobacteraceae bacterium]